MKGREIKFRVYCKSLKCVFDVGNLDLYGQKITLYQDKTWVGEYSFDEVELMEYTGLKDKKGREICGGHIVLLNETPKKVYEKPQEIFWSHGAFCVGRKGDFEEKLYFQTCSKRYRK